MRTLSVPEGTWSGASGVSAPHLMRGERGSVPASPSARSVWYFFNLPTSTHLIREHLSRHLPTYESVSIEPPRLTYLPTPPLQRRGCKQRPRARRLGDSTAPSMARAGMSDEEMTAFKESRARLTQPAYRP